MKGYRVFLFYVFFFDIEWNLIFVGVGGFDCIYGKIWVLFWCCFGWVCFKWWGNLIVIRNWDLLVILVGYIIVF